MGDTKSDDSTEQQALKRITAFSQWPLISRLIKNNTILYAGALREALAGTDVVKYLRTHNGAVVGWNERHAQELLERDIGEMVVSSQICQIASGFTSVRYTIDLQRATGEDGSVDTIFDVPNRTTIPLVIQYVGQYSHTETFPKVEADVNIVQLSRQGLSLRCIPRETAFSHNPFGEILRNIMSRKFTLVNRTSLSASWLRQRKERLVSIGWELVGGCVIDIDARDDDSDCPVCLQPLNAGGEAVSVWCGHRFHRSCWDEHDSPSREGVRESLHCPVCRSDIPLWGR